ncbi:4-coumarate--CoA ligase 2-like [Octopus sinensis]|uniref:Luciferin 4-monooxygenase n=1 Tax=Octopus sinensis TaxID=2607531 RepID=A0A7E6EXE5_9MOLL|nr:4-coumarate--CoA ligase 2-like [Octopus sinensis]
MLQNSLRPNLYSLTSKIISKSGTTQKCQKNGSWLLNHGKYKSCSSIPISCYPFSTTCCLQQTKAGIIESAYKPLTIPDNVDFGSFILSHLEQYKDRPLIENGLTGVKYSYSDVISKSLKVASAFKKSGYKPGDVIAVFSTNNPEYLLVYIAAAAAGLTTTTMNSAYSAKELKFHLENSECCAIITTEELVSTVKEAVGTSETVKLKEIIVFGNSHGCRPFSTLVEDDGTALTEVYSGNAKEDVLVLPYSSGTTGLPKGVMLTHHNIVSNLLQLTVLKLDTSDRILGILPFYHIYGMVCILFSIITNGCSIYTLPKFEPEIFLSTLSKNRITCVHLVPPLILFLAKHPLVEDYDLSAIRRIFSGAAPLGKELVLKCKERLGVQEMIQGYGLTETSPVVHVSVPPIRHEGSVGTLIPNTAAKIIDPETNEILGPMQTGELCIKGPQVMKGYLNRPEATADMIRDGWLYSGDLAHYDEDGHFYITDRLKELIKYKGFQVAPAELEALLITHPDIKDCAVIGIPDEKAGELPRAYVVSNDKSTIREEDVLNFTKANVAPYKQLRGGVEFVPEIPKSAAGKILRRILRDSYKNKLND